MCGDNDKMFIIKKNKDHISKQQNESHNEMSHARSKSRQLISVFLLVNDEFTQTVLTLLDGALQVLLVGLKTQEKA